MSLYKVKTGKGMRLATLLLLLLFFFNGSGCSKVERPKKPVARDGWITDRANFLPQPDKFRMSASLDAYEKETCHQVFVLIVPSLEGENLTSFSQRTATAWDIGQSGFGNGILLTIAMQEGSLRLETASAFDWFVEQGITDRILKEVMVPYFREERFTEGIEQGLAEIMLAARLKVIPEDHKPEACRK